MSKQPQYIESIILKQLQRRKKILASFSLVGLGVLAYSYFKEPHWLEITHHQLKVPDLPPEWRGYRIAWLSDLHIRKKDPTPTSVRDAFAAVVQQKPDLAILGGDIFDYGNWIPASAFMFASLTQAGIQTISIMGNHDYWSNRAAPQHLINELAALNIRTLVNDAIAIERGGVKQWIIGIDDVALGVPDWAETTRKLPEGVKPLLYLAHNPRLMDMLPSNYAALSLGGHTHGGQLNPALPPFQRRLNWVKWAKGDMSAPYPQGWYNVRGNPLYVGRGLGTTRYPVRFNARPELPIIELI